MAVIQFDKLLIAIAIETFLVSNPIPIGIIMPPKWFFMNQINRKRK